jgi:hypothetical protein
MEADNRETEKCSAEIGSTPHLQEQPLLVLLNLIPSRTTNFIQLGLKFMFVDVVITKLPECFLSLLFFTLDHEPARTFWEEDNHNSLNGWGDKEDGKGDLIRAFGQDGVSSKVNARTDDGADRKHDLVESKDDATEMSWCSFLDVELREGKEPSDGDT